eukprot:3268082-Prymnesium_polylepis.1
MCIRDRPRGAALGEAEEREEGGWERESKRMTDGAERDRGREGNVLATPAAPAVPRRAPHHAATRCATPRPLLTHPAA